MTYQRRSGFPTSVAGMRTRRLAARFAVLAACGLLSVPPATAQPTAAGVAAPAAEPLSTGEFKIESTGVRRSLYIEVLQRFREPALADFLQKIMADEEQMQKKFKSALVVKPKPAPKEEKDAKPSRWQVYVPADYDGVAPFGVMAYVNSAESSALPKEYKPVLDARRLIWISAEGAGNDTGTTHRMAMALEGIRRLRDKGYVLDADRIYVSGISGGGRVASNLGVLFPDFVTGGVYFAGINAYRDVPAGGGNFLPRSMSPSPQLLSAAKERRHVTVFGKKDTVAGYVPAVAQDWTRDGFRNFFYLELPDLGHTIPPAAEFEKAVEYLDAPLAAGAKKEYDAAASAFKKNTLGRALDGFRQALAHAPKEPFAEDARTRAAELGAQYAAALASLEAAAAGVDFKKYTTEAAKFKKMWDPLASAELDRLHLLHLNAREAKLGAP